MFGKGLLTIPRIWRGCFLLACIGAGTALAGPALIITNLPPYGSTANLGGLVLGVPPTEARVAVFIEVPGYGWVTKPTCAQPLTPIQPDGSWSVDITTGGTDELATRIAALLVATNYNEPCVLGLAFLPPNVWARALARAVITRPYPGPRWLRFSGYDWWVKKSGPGPVGPGPNYFSDSPDNVWVDAQGRLHLRITHRTNQWQCAELVSARTFGYGSYRFQLESPADDLDPNAVLGLFTWSDDPAYAYREIDIECARWGNAADPNNAQFVVQPYDQPGHLARLAVPAGQTNAALLFTWETNRVRFQAQRGRFSPQPAPGAVITNWTCSLGVPQTGDENVRLNLWLFNGQAPARQQEVEVIISQFQFVPLDAPRSGLLTNATRLPGGSCRFTLEGDFDRWYQVLASSDLNAWQELATILATNRSLNFEDSAAAGFARRFYRVLTLP